MPKHLWRDMDRLKKDILTMGSMVEESINKSISALNMRDGNLAGEVIDADRSIDLREVEVEEECLKVLALHQPVAADLRSIITILKVNNDLERMGDLASNIAERARFLAEHEPIGTPEEMAAMVADVQKMVHMSLDAMVNENAEMAREVLAHDDRVDDANRKMFRILQDRMKTSPDQAESFIQMLTVSRNLERIADLATNIAEDVVFMVEGDVIRHQE